MRDQEARQQIQELKRQIVTLQEETRVRLTKQEHLAIIQGDHPCRYGYSIKDVVESVLDYLGVEVEFMPMTAGYYRLKEREKDK